MIMLGPVFPKYRIDIRSARNKMNPLGSIFGSIFASKSGYNIYNDNSNSTANVYNNNTATSGYYTSSNVPSGQFPPLPPPTNPNASAPAAPVAFPTHSVDPNSNGQPTTKARPEKLCSMIRKQGHVIRNWKWRYFILDNGSLTYYSSPPGNSSDKKGQIEWLRNYSVGRQDERCMQLSLPGKYLLNLEFVETSDRETWFREITNHIEYANTNRQVNSNNSICTIT